MDYRNKQVYVGDLEDSHRVQNILFEAGCRWMANGTKLLNITYRYIGINKEKGMGFSTTEFINFETIEMPKSVFTKKDLKDFM